MFVGMVSKCSVACFFLVVFLFAAAAVTSFDFNHSLDAIVLTTPDALVRKSSLTIYEQFAVPGSQGWARCKNCVLSRTAGLIALHNNSDSRESNNSVFASWSLWSEFFHRFQNDRYSVSIMNSDGFQINHSVSRPVFIIPMITFHVGHVLIDLLEQIYDAHMTYYGRIRKDCIIILDVASQFERPVLQKKINIQVNSGDEVGALLRLLTDSPVMSIEAWDSLRKLKLENIAFTDIHIGADISRSFFNTGQLIQPCVMSIKHGNARNFALSQKYRRFALFLQEATKTKSKTSQKGRISPRKSKLNVVHAPSILIIQRRKNRVILNVEELAIQSSSAGYVTETMDLEDVSFTVQMKQLAQTDVLVSVAGTALHNVLFMRPGSAIVIFMQPGWCEYAWMYANQAILLGIKPFIYCTPSTPPIQFNNAAAAFTEQTGNALLSHDDERLFRHYGWTRQAWLQGPRQSKSDNITVDVNLFVGLLTEAVEHTEPLRSGTGGGDGDSGGDKLKKRELGDKSLDPLMCPGQTIRAYTPSSSSSSSTTTTTSSSSTISSTNKNLTQDMLRDRLIDVYISAISVQYLKAEETFKLGIAGEIGAAQGDIAELLQSMPRMAICMEAEEMAPWCHPLGAFNYYTDLLLHMAQPRQGLHVWAQVSKTGGKIRNSDIYVVLDCRLPEAGFRLHSDVVGRNVEFELLINEQCVLNESSSSVTASSAQVLAFPTHKFKESAASPEWLCQKSRRVLFSRYMNSRLSFQRYTADFCLIQSITASNCIEFIVALQRHLLQSFQAETLRLPPVQVAPSVKNPFFFIHVEKTAGSTLREYIHNSTVQRGLQAIIPCHTMNCLVLAAPLHRDSSINNTDSDPTVVHDIGADGASTVSTSAATAFSENISSEPSVDWSNLQDLRLIQPRRQNNRNISVMAGHFDYFTPFRSLPECIPTSTSTNTDYGVDSSRENASVEKEWSTHPWFIRQPGMSNHLLVPSAPEHPPCKVSCFTVGRHPVDRAISFFYQRIYRHSKPGKNSTVDNSNSDSDSGSGSPIFVQKRINDLTPAELEQIALSTRQGAASHFYPNVSVFVDDGMTDAACSALLGIKLTVGLVVSPSLTLPPEIPPNLYPIAQQNLQQCVVGLQDRWKDTLQVLDTWFPWIDFSVDPSRKRMALYAGKENRTTLRPELYEVLARLNPCDMMLYEETKRLFELQLQVVEGKFY